MIDMSPTLNRTTNHFSRGKGRMAKTGKKWMDVRECVGQDGVAPIFPTNGKIMGMANREANRLETS